MISSYHQILLAFTTALFFAGCNNGTESPKAVDTRSQDNTVPTETIFRAGSGVLLSPQGREAIELQTAEVLPAIRSHSSRQTLQVYRGAGETASASASARTRPGYAYASVILPAKQARALESGQPIQLLGTEPVTQARLMGLDWQLEPVTGQAEALVEIPDQERRWKVGSFVEARFDSSSENPAETDLVAVPEEAVLTTVKGTFVYTANGAYFIRTPVDVASRSRGEALIADGLFNGDVIASRGVQQLYLIELQATNGGKGCAHGH